ncbi:hypothetical protein PENTCL1PPCAC_29487, partial [Pristionchus entomophagus]
QENKEKGVKNVHVHKSVKRKGKPKVCTPPVEDEQANEDLNLFQPLPKCFKQVKSEQQDQMDKSSSEETGSEEINEESESAAEKHREESEEPVPEEGERFLVDPDVDENHGYLQGLKGHIVSHDLLQFDNKEKETYFKVVFLDLQKSFWMRYDVVRQYDPAGYRMYLRECILRDKEAKKAEDARRYREFHGI